MTVTVEHILSLGKNKDLQEIKIFCLFLNYKMRIRVMIFLITNVSETKTILIQHCV